MMLLIKLLMSSNWNPRKTISMNLDDIIIVENGDMFEGTRGQFTDCFFINATDEQITGWCVENDWSLTINGNVIIGNVHDN